MVFRRLITCWKRGHCNQLDLSIRILNCICIDKLIENQTPSLRNLIGRSMTTPKPVSSPSSITPHLRVIVLPLTEGKFRLALQKLYFSFFILTHLQLSIKTWRYFSTTCMICDQLPAHMVTRIYLLTSKITGISSERWCGLRMAGIRYVSSSRLPCVSLLFHDSINACLPRVALLFVLDHQHSNEYITLLQPFYLFNITQSIRREILYWLFRNNARVPIPSIPTTQHYHRDWV
jgi:hypothetical protein